MEYVAIAIACVALAIIWLAICVVGVENAVLRLREEHASIAKQFFGKFRVTGRELPDTWQNIAKEVAMQSPDWVVTRGVETINDALGAIVPAKPAKEDTGRSEPPAKKKPKPKPKAKKR